MKISLITVSYNSAVTIKDTFDSVLKQVYPDIEYIVIDGQSKDDTVDIIRSYEILFKGRMKWISEPDSGFYEAMNKGILMATGDIVGIINSDDFFCDCHAIEKIVSEFQSNQGLDAIYADLYYVAKNDASKIVRKWTTGTQKLFRTGWHPAHPALYIKKEIYGKYGLFNLKYKLAADFEIMLRFLDKYKIKASYLPESLIKMRLGGETNRSIRNIYKQNIECLKAFKENKIQVNRISYPIRRLFPKLLQYK